MKIVVILLGFIAVTTALAAQGSATPDGTTQALVLELRALRADLPRVAGSSIRTQLLVSRLQLQEQRVLAVSNQLAGVQREGADVVRARAGLDAEIERVEGDPGADANGRAAMEAQAKQMRSQLASLRQREQQLRQRESELSATLADEQARWSDFSARLDELERALLSPR
jgi:chromosome segregation ATPase